MLHYKKGITESELEQYFNHLLKWLMIPAIAAIEIARAYWFPQRIGFELRVFMAFTLCLYLVLQFSVYWILCSSFSYISSWTSNYSICFIFLLCAASAPFFTSLIWLKLESNYGTEPALEILNNSMLTMLPVTVLVFAAGRQLIDKIIKKCPKKGVQCKAVMRFQSTGTSNEMYVVLRRLEGTVYTASGEPDTDLYFRVLALLNVSEGTLNIQEGLYEKLVGGIEARYALPQSLWNGWMRIKIA